MGSKQKILVFILLLAIIVSLFLGWHFIIKKPDFTNSGDFIKDKTSTKIASMLQIEKSDKANYDVLLNKYKELKNKRIALDDQISEIEQQIAKINRVNPISANATEDNVVILTDAATKPKDISSSNAQPLLQQEVASAPHTTMPVVAKEAPTSTANTAPLPDFNGGNALSPTPIVALTPALNQSKPSAQRQAAKNTAVNIVKESTNKVVIISPKKKHQKQQKTSATSQATSNEEQNSAQTSGTDVELANTVPANNESASVITVSKNSVEENTVLPEGSKNDVANKSEVQVVNQAASKESAVPVVPAKIISSAAKQNYYVVQIMSSDKASDITSFMNRKNLGDKAVCLKTQRNGSDWYILAYGNYDSRSQAASAIKSLPSSIRSLHPWVKPINSSEVTNISQ